jgi:hypothetical protein
VSAVRRAREPGCKFDQIIVFEGPEGNGKSSAIEILAGKETHRLVAASNRSLINHVAVIDFILKLGNPHPSRPCQPAQPPDDSIISPSLLSNMVED